MREKLADVTHVLLLGTVHHSLAVANMLAPTVKTVCVDIDPAAVARVVNQQPFQSVGLVTDVEPFLHELAENIAPAERAGRRGTAQEITGRAMRELLLCPPDYYGIEYEINPWMSRARGRGSGRGPATMERVARQTCQPGLQNLSGRAPAKIARHGFYRQRRPGCGKEIHSQQFPAQGTGGRSAPFRSLDGGTWIRNRWLPENLYFEGEGDALFGGDALFCGYKFRSDIQSHRAVADILGCLVISVELVDPRFYHLDTCFCPLRTEALSGFRPRSMSTASAPSAIMSRT